MDTARARTAVGLAAAGGSAAELSWRVLRSLNLYRLSVAVVLLVLFAAGGRPQPVGQVYPELFQWWLTGYLAFAIVSALTLWLQRPPPFVQLCLAVAADVVAITALMHASGGVGSGLGLLLIVPVAVAALVVRARISLLFAAVAALAVLLEQLISQLEGTTTSMQFTPAGLLGAMLFLVALAVYPYARRLAESEALAEQRGIDLKNLSELSEYIIQQLRESIVVVDDANVVRLVNESAAAHLGAPDLHPGRPLADVSPALAALIARWRAGEAPDTEQPPLTSADGSTGIVPQIAPMGAGRAGPLLVFLEDPAHMAERVQQMKLASLGRLSASIAHEIRNPVGAMSHAGQLLAESAEIPPEERRLVEIITTNGSRVSSIIDSVLSMSRRQHSRPEKLELGEWLARFVADYSSSHELPDNALTVRGVDRPMEVRMDPLHLNQIAWNLCDNAVRYASEHGGGIAVELDAGRLPGSGRPYLDVADRGPGVADEVRERIFEPFVTGTHGGTGLGLYLSRELCESNGAVLRYLPRDGGGSIFRIVFADPERWDATMEQTATEAHA